MKLWTQLLIVDGILRHHYSLEPDSELITVPVLPHALQQDPLYQAHDIPGSGHQEHDKTLQKLHLNAYRVGMSGDVTEHCMKCTVCQ